MNTTGLAIKMNEPKKTVILSVLAHPEVHLVCATRGEVGEMDEQYLRGFNSIAERRENELRCASGILGLTGVHFLGYRDSGMPGSADNLHPQALAAQPIDKVTADVVHFIRLLKPQVVLTFDPIGGYRHPDHIAIQQATEKAFFAASNPAEYTADLTPHKPEKLYFHTIPRGFLKLMVRIMPFFRMDPRRFGTNKDIDLASIAEVDFPIHAIIDYHTVARQRDEASACHASQGGSKMGGGLFGPLRRLLYSQDRFMRAYPVPQNNNVERDLLEGLC
jgi:N-acetyl-1-D-myo-inositol-2-amino-2-deoxy-alpha-D-glucopyranoside deacetylase